jgi:eukaryotic-like serine/threonine-protein kinase
MGVVYEVEHIHTGKRLALKVLSSQPGASVERFKREARAASLIRSEHIVLVTDADVAPELGGAPFLVMELLEGSDLERATANRPTPPTEVVAWLRQVARALGKAHEAGLVHRDLKPENLFLSQREDGTPLVKLLDFGIAKMNLDGAGLTASDAFLGTPGYMAPEQTDSKGPPITLRADLYALGLIAFKLLTGRTYWVTGSLAQLLAQLLAEPMPPASERGATLGPAFDAWFAKACDRDPENRFASAEEQVEALAEALGLPTEPARQPGAVTRAREHSLPVGEKHEASSLNGSARDLVGRRWRVARQRLLGGGLVATLVGMGVAAAVVRNGSTPRALPPAGASPPVARPTLPKPVTLPAPEIATASALPAASLSAAPSAAPAHASARALPKRAPAASVASMRPTVPPPTSAPPSPPPAPAVDPLDKLRTL